jgi:heptosyltransferase I
VKREAPDMLDVERLMVLKMSALGDIAKAIPTVDTIRAAYPHLRIAWIVRRGFHDLIVGNPSIDELIVAGRSARGFIEAGLAARRFRPQVLLDMQGLFLTGCLARMSGAAWRCTWDSGRELSWLLTGNAIVPGPPTRNAVECLFGFAHAIGIPAVPLVRPAYLAEDPQLGERAEALLTDCPRPRVALHIGASEANKSWPAEHWATLVDALHADGASVLLLGGPSDAEAGRQVEERAASGVRSLVGRTTIRELAAVIAHCDLFVGGDSGATHIAALVQTPVVCLMGPTSPARTGPYGERHTVIHLGMSCSPCYRRPTCDGRFGCMRDIRPRQVAEACRSRLSEARRCA